MASILVSLAILMVLITMSTQAIKPTGTDSPGATVDLLNRNGSDARSNALTPTFGVGRQSGDLQRVLLYRGENQSLQPYFYHEPRGTQTPRVTRTTSASSNKDHHMESSDHNVQMTTSSNQQAFETRGLSTRIRYDGEPFESIESLREVQGLQGTRGTYKEQKYDTLSGGIFNEDSDSENRRHSDHKQRVIFNKESTVPMNRKHVLMQNGHHHVYDRSRNNGGRARPSTTRRRQSRPPPPPVYSEPKAKIRVTSSPPLDDHYHSGYDEPTRTGALQGYYGNDFDYENYELANRGPYGDRIMQATSAINRNQRLSTDLPMSMERTRQTHDHSPPRTSTSQWATDSYDDIEDYERPRAGITRKTPKVETNRNYYHGNHQRIPK